MVSVSPEETSYGDMLDCTVQRELHLFLRRPTKSCLNYCNLHSFLFIDAIRSSFTILLPSFLLYLAMQNVFKQVPRHPFSVLMFESIFHNELKSFLT